MTATNTSLANDVKSPADSTSSPVEAWHKSTPEETKAYWDGQAAQKAAIEQRDKDQLEKDAPKYHRPTPDIDSYQGEVDKSTPQQLFDLEHVMHAHDTGLPLSYADWRKTPEGIQYGKDTGLDN